MVGVLQRTEDNPSSNVADDFTDVLLPLLGRTAHQEDRYVEFVRKRQHANLRPRPNRSPEQRVPGGRLPCAPVAQNDYGDLRHIVLSLPYACDNPRELSDAK